MIAAGSETDAQILDGTVPGRLRSSKKRFCRARGREAEIETDAEATGDSLSNIITGSGQNGHVPIEGNSVPLESVPGGRLPCKSDKPRAESSTR